MTRKTRTNITVDPDVLRKAHELGLNVSKVCENALKDAIRRLEQPTIQTETNGGYIDARSVSFEDRRSLGRDSNPRPPPYQGDALANWATEAHVPKVIMRL